MNQLMHRTPPLTMSDCCTRRLADMWTTSIDEDEYVAFLTLLLDHVAPRHRSATGEWVRSFLDPHDVQLADVTSWLNGAGQSASRASNRMRHARQKRRARARQTAKQRKNFMQKGLKIDLNQRAR